MDERIYLELINKLQMNVALVSDAKYLDTLRIR
jgi:hypothetical protein